MTIEKTWLDLWRGEAGAVYPESFGKDRRVLAVKRLKSAVGGLAIESALEVGCNLGLYLLSLPEALGHTCQLTGIEPNVIALHKAAANARELGLDVALREGTAYDLPFENRHFDLVLTSQMLIHIPDEHVEKAIDEVHRVCRRYLLIAEYSSDESKCVKRKVPGQGMMAWLWLRNWKKLFMERFPDLALVHQGQWTKLHGFWLFEKA